MANIDELKKKIEERIPGSDVELTRNRDNQNRHLHIKAVVTSKEFEGKSLVEQHRMVYNALKENMNKDIHALLIETKTK